MANSVTAKNAGRARGDGLIKRLVRFLRESYIEVVKKASWPSVSELKKMTTVVIVAVLIVAFYIGGVDYVLSRISGPLFDIGVRK